MEEPKRQTTRVKPSRVLVRIASAEAMRTHYLKDLSERGLFLKVDKPLPVGAEVVLELVPPGWDSSLPLAGRVVRVADDSAARAAGAAGMALRFDKLEPEIEKRLKALVDEYASPPAAAPGGQSEVERLKTQIQGLVFELGAAREARQAIEAKLTADGKGLAEAQQKADNLARANLELLTRCESLKSELAAKGGAAASGQGAAGLAEAHAQVASARVELAQAQGQLGAAKQSATAHEKEATDARAQVERLNTEKKQIEQRWLEEAERVAIELEKLRTAQIEGARQLELLQVKARELTQSLTAERAARRAVEEAVAGDKRARAAAESKVETLQKQLTEAKAARADAGAADGKAKAAAQQLETERAHTAKLEARLAEATEQLERAKVKERDLRRLLSMVPAGGGGEAVVVIEDESEAPPPQEEATIEVADTGLDELVQVEEDAAPAAPESIQLQDMASLDAEPIFDATANLEPLVTDTITEETPVPAVEPAVIELFSADDTPTVIPSPDLAAELFGAETESPEPAPAEPLATPQPVTESPGEGSWSTPAPDVAASGLGGEWGEAVPPPPPSEWGDVPGEEAMFEAESGESSSADGPTAEIEFSASGPTEEMPDLDADAVEQDGEQPPSLASAPVRATTEDWAFLDLSEIPASMTPTLDGPLPYEVPEELTPRPAPAPTAPGTQPIELAEFEKRVRAGARLARTQRFYQQKPGDASEDMVNAWLAEADTLLALVRLAKGRLSADRITKVLHGHYSRGLLELAAG